jgi:hypothetical protein
MKSLKLDLEIIPDFGCYFRIIVFSIKASRFSWHSVCEDARKLSMISGSSLHQ